MKRIFVLLMLICSISFADSYSGAYREGTFTTTMTSTGDGYLVPVLPDGIESFMTHVFVDGQNRYTDQIAEGGSINVGDVCLVHVVVHVDDISNIEALPTYLGVGHSVRETQAYQELTGTTDPIWIFYEDEYAALNDDRSVTVANGVMALETKTQTLADGYENGE